jgi:hypothetical protein
MKALERNKTDFYYALYKSTGKIVGEDGYNSGEPKIVYDDPVHLRANISASTGSTFIEAFGNLNDYSKVIVTTDMDWPIDESSVLWVDSLPIFDEETGKVLNKPDYVVKHIAKSLNSVAYAIDKVKRS